MNAIKVIKLFWLIALKTFNIFRQQTYCKNNYEIIDKMTIDF